MENGLKFVMLGAAALLTILVVAFAVSQYQAGARFGQIAEDKTADVAEDMDELEFTQLEGNTYNGGFVLSKINEYDGDGGDYIVVVTTSKPDTQQYISSGTVNASSYSVSGNLTALTSAANRTNYANAKDKNDNSYINFNGDFLANVLRGDNDEIRGLLFTQQ